MGTAIPGKAGEAAFVDLDPPATAPITSPLVMRPSRPVPATCAGLIFFSAIILAAEGAALATGAAAGFVAGAALLAAADATAIAGAAVAEAVAVLSIFAMT